MHLNMICPCGELTSYQLTGKNIVKELVKSGHQPSLFSIGQPESCQEDAQYVKISLSNKEKFDYNAPSIRIWHADNLAEHVGKGIKIGFPIWELDTFRQDEIHHLNFNDIIFCASPWAKQILENNGINKPSYVIPLGINPEIFNIDVKPYCQFRETVFLAAGKWEHRKSIPEVIESFNNAFELKDNVKLYLLCHNVFLNENEIAYWHGLVQNSKLASKISILPRLDSQQKVASLMKAVDCGIYISKAEGFNLELLETMAVGTHVIASNNTAHTQLVDENNALIIDTPNKIDAYDGRWFFNTGKWHDLDNSAKEQVITHMRAIHAKKQSGQLGYNMTGTMLGKRMTWKNTANTIVSKLKEII